MLATSYHNVNMLKWQTSFNPEWTKEHEFISKSSRDAFHGCCTLCHCEVDVSSQGKAAIGRHASTEKHKSNRWAAGTSSLRSFFREATSPQNDKISAYFSHSLFVYLCIYFISRSPELLCFQALCTLQDRFISVVSFWNRQECLE